METTETSLPSETRKDSKIFEPPTKRSRVVEPPTPYFHTTKFDSITNEIINELIEIFTKQFSSLSRAVLNSLPKNTTIQNSFIVLQVINSRNECHFMQQKRWRLLCREILPDGMRGDCFYLTITDFLPVVAEKIPEDFKKRTEWLEMKSQPVIILSGFRKEVDQFMNPEWKANIMCSPECVPQILIATVPKPTAPLFVSDFGILPQNAVSGNRNSLPFAAFNAAQQAMYSSGSGNGNSNSNSGSNGSGNSNNNGSGNNNGGGNSNSNSGGNGNGGQSRVSTSPSAVYTVPLMYTPLAKLTPRKEHYSVIGVVKNFFPPRLVNRGQSYMQTFHIVDPSLDISQDEKLICFAYQPNPEKLPPFSKTGDIIILKNLHVIIFNDQKQGKLYTDSGRFVLINNTSGNVETRPGSNTRVTPSDVPSIERLLTWYNDVAERILSEIEAKYRKENEQKTPVPFTDNIRTDEHTSVIHSPGSVSSVQLDKVNSREGAGSRAANQPALGENLLAGEILPVGGAVPAGESVPTGDAVPAGETVPTGDAVPAGESVSVGGAVAAGEILPVGGAVPAGEGVPTGGAVSVNPPQKNSTVQPTTLLQAQPQKTTKTFTDHLFCRTV